MKSKKVLFVATVVKKHINVFHLPYLQWFQEQEYEAHVAARDDFNGEECIIPHCDKYFDIPFERSPLNKNNIKAYKQLKKIINENNYEIIHCHTPVAAMLTRLAARKSRRSGTKVIYTAHGFHFFKGASLINWLIYFPVEWICSFLTDTLITINREDYNLAKRLMQSKKIEYVNGVGINTNIMTSGIQDKNIVRKKLKIPNDAIVLLSVGELSKRKNHEFVIKSLAKIENDNIYYLICGEGDLYSYLSKLSEDLHLKQRVIFLGFRKDVRDICRSSDIFVFPSLQEGLPVSLMEAMSIGLPVICSNVRGNRDLIQEKSCIFELNDLQKLTMILNELIKNPTSRERLGIYNKENIKKYSLEYVLQEMIDIYSSSLT